MVEIGFREKLARRQKKANSLVCVGLDPLPEKLPKSIVGFKYEWEKVAYWMCQIVDATAQHASMYKPQRAYYEAMRGGEFALRRIISHIKHEHPDIPVFLDCKRGDIARTQKMYGKAHLELDGAGGMNFSPYMGMDCMSELHDEAWPGAGIVGLCRTSNPAAWEIQDIKLPDGRRLYEYVAERILAWADSLGITENAGLVMGAAHKTEPLLKCIHYQGELIEGSIFSEHLRKIRALVGDRLWFLIPGIGTQGGFILETIRAAYAGHGSVAINSSSGIIFASSNDDYREASALKAKELQDQINEAMN